MEKILLIRILHKTMQSFYGAAECGPAAQPPKMSFNTFLGAPQVRRHFTPP